jgi:hypothetical protein
MHVPYKEAVVVKKLPHRRLNRIGSRPSVRLAGHRRGQCSTKATSGAICTLHTMLFRTVPQEDNVYHTLFD